MVRTPSRSGRRPLGGLGYSTRFNKGGGGASGVGRRTIDTSVWLGQKTAFGRKAAAAKLATNDRNRCIPLKNSPNTPLATFVGVF